MKSQLPEKENKREYVREMFARIAGRYNLMNRIMSLGQDVQWRRMVVKKLNPHSNGFYLDVGAGTGDLTLEILKQSAGAKVVAVDLTYQMLAFGRITPDVPGVFQVVADAQALPFPDETFSGAVSGYLLRNVPDIRQAILEQKRVITNKSGIVSLDTTPPERNFLYPFIYFYLKYVIPVLGWIIVRDRSAYDYLPESTRKHISAIDLARIMEECGLTCVNWKKRMFGTMAIHYAEKCDGNR